MLSKSAAKFFFLSGTGVCALTFGLLTVDTIQRVPAQTHAENLNASVIRGKDLWDKNNCMGCHTLLGEGAYYAPELTRVYERRGPEFIRSMLKDPQAMYPGQRKMVQYNFNPEEIEDLVAFFQWIGGMDLNGFPPKPDLALAQATTSDSVAEAPTTFKQMCVACHSVRGQGGQIGPALDGVKTRRDTEYLTNWLHDPLAIKPDSRMPKLPLTEEDITTLVSYLQTL